MHHWWPFFSYFQLKAMHKIVCCMHPRCQHTVHMLGAYFSFLAKNYSLVPKSTRMTVVQKTRVTDTGNGSLKGRSRVYICMTRAYMDCVPLRNVRSRHRRLLTAWVVEERGRRGAVKWGQWVRLIPVLIFFVLLLFFFIIFGYWREGDGKTAVHFRFLCNEDRPLFKNKRTFYGKQTVISGHSAFQSR